MSRTYSFNANDVRDRLYIDIANWERSSGSKDKKIIFYIDGTVNSHIGAIILSKIFGPDRIIALAESNNEVADKLCNYIGVPITKIHAVSAEAITLIYASKDIINKRFPDADPEVNKFIRKATEDRLIMTKLYSLSNLIEARVYALYTLSDRTIGWRTKYGVTGDCTPLAKLTYSEVIEIGKTINVPELYYTDVSNIKMEEAYPGITYDMIDKFVRENIDESPDETITRLNNEQASHKENMPYTYTPAVADLYKFG